MIAEALGLHVSKNINRNKLYEQIYAAL